MPTLTVVTNAEMSKQSAQDLVKALTDCIYPIAECPQEHVHAHVMHSQELSREKKDQMAGGIQAALVKAVPSLNPGRTQVLFEGTTAANIAIGGAMLPM